MGGCDMEIERGRLQLVVSPAATVGTRIQAHVRAENVPETGLTVHVPDTMLLSGPKEVYLGYGTFEILLEFDVIEAQQGLVSIVEFEVTAGSRLYQMGLCRVRG
jgi:hypothetical protein